MQARRTALAEARGLWRERDDLADEAGWLRSLRSGRRRLGQVGLCGDGGREP